MTSVINSLGGFFTPNELRACALAAYASNKAGIYIGARQEVIIPEVDPNHVEFKKLNSQIEVYDKSTALPNLICSHASGGLDLNSDWAYEKDAYQEALSEFDFKPNVSVALLAMGQNFSSGLSSQVNFVASAKEHYWHLILRIGDESTLLPILFLTEEIAAVTKYIDETLSKEAYKTSAWIIRHLLEMYPSAPLGEKMTRSILREGFKEGFIEMPSGRYSLNIYPDKGLFPWQHIEGLCAVAHTLNVKRIYPTPAGSLLIKHIKKSDLPTWKQTLGKLAVSLRHSEEELSVYTDQSCVKNRKLAAKLLKTLQNKDFAFHAQNIAVNPDKLEDRSVYHISSIKAGFFTRYNLKVKGNFDPRETSFKANLINLSYSDLVNHLLSFNKEFYSETSIPEAIILEPKLVKSEEKVESEVYECQDCLSHYSSEYGDSVQDVPAGTLFEELPHSWVCPVCDSEKERFKPYVAARPA